MTRDFLLAFLRAFVVTQMVEVPIYRLGYGASLPRAFGASAITHPLVWFVFFGPFSPLDDLSYVPRLVMAELFAWLVEAGWLALTVRKPHALRWSAIANLASIAVGALLRATLGFP